MATNNNLPAVPNAVALKKTLDSVVINPQLKKQALLQANNDMSAFKDYATKIQTQNKANETARKAAEKQAILDKSTSAAAKASSSSLVKNSSLSDRTSKVQSNYETQRESVPYKSKFTVTPEKETEMLNQLRAGTYVSPLVKRQQALANGTDTIGSAATAQERKNQIGENIANQIKVSDKEKLQNKFAEHQRNLFIEHASDNKNETISPLASRQKIVEQGGDTINSARTYGEQRKSIGEDIAKKYQEGEEWLTTDTGNDYLSKGLINNFRSTIGKDIEDFGYFLGDNFGYKPGTDTYNKGEARKISEASQGQMQALSKETNGMYDDLTGAVNSLANMGAYMLLPGGVTHLAAYMGAGNGLDKYVEQREMGKSKEEALIRGSLYGAMSYAAEKLGGIGGGANSPLKSLENAASKQWFTKVLWQALDEGGEEFVEYVGDYLIDAISDGVFGDSQAKFGLAEAWQNVKQGALAGGIAAAGNVGSFNTGNPEVDAELEQTAKDIPEMVKNSLGKKIKTKFAEFKEKLVTPKAHEISPTDGTNVLESNLSTETQNAPTEQISREEQLLKQITPKSVVEQGIDEVLNSKFSDARKAYVLEQLAETPNLSAKDVAAIRNAQSKLNGAQKTQYVTVAPYYDTEANANNEIQLRKAAETEFFNNANNFANKIGASIAGVAENIGGFTNNKGKHVNEVSYTFELNGTENDIADAFAAHMAEQGYQQQEATISYNYAPDVDSATALEYDVGFKNISPFDVVNILDSIGITDYTIDKKNNLVKLLGFDLNSSEEIDTLSENLKNALGGNYNGTGYGFINSRYVNQGFRETLYSKRLQEDTGRPDQDLYNIYREDKSKLDRYVETGEPSLKNQTNKAEAESPGYFNAQDGNYGQNTVGAAQVNPQSYYHATNEYGTIPPGENPARVVDVPTSMDGKTKVSNYARTVMEAAVTPDELIENLQKRVEDGTFSHKVITDKKALKVAQDTIASAKNYNEAVSNWLSDKTVNKYHIATGEMLLSTAAEKLDIASFNQISAELQVELTNAGQAAQAARLLKKMSPEGRLRSLQKAAQKFTTKDGKVPTISDESKAKLFSAKTEAERLDAEDAIQNEIAKQADRKSMWRNWRYLAMLGNVRTHARNILGNAAMYSVSAIKTGIESGLQKALKNNNWYKEHGGEQTAAFFTTKAQRNAAEQYLKEDMRVLTSGGKWSDESAIESKIPSKGGKLFNRLVDPNNKALEAEDAFFLKMNYKTAFAGYLAANDIDPQNISPAQLQEARDFSILVAQYNTFRNNSALAEAITKMANSSPGAKIAMEAVLPFKKTPANILSAAVDYSLLGLLHTVIGVKKTGLLASDLVKVNNYEMSATDMIDHVAKGLTGTGIATLGFLLAQAGLLTGGKDEDDKEAAFDSLQGGQNYAIKIGDGSYTLDWLAPVCMPLFVGVEASNIAEDYLNGENNGGDIYTAVLGALTKLADPMTEMSMLQSVSDLFKRENFGEAVQSVVGNYLSQYIPTVFGQVARTIDDTSRNAYYVDKTNDIPDTFEVTINKLIAKIPGLSKTLPARVDNWGREEKNADNVMQRAFEQLISPGYYKKNSTTKVDELLSQIYAKTGNKAVLPTKADNSVTIDGKTKNLSSEEYVKAQKAKGATAYKTIEELRKDPNFQKANAEQKAKMISLAYEYATVKGKEAVSSYKPSENWYSEMEQAKKDGIVNSKGEYISYKNLLSQITPDKNGDATVKTVNEKLLEQLVADTRTDSKKDLALYSIFGTSDISGVNKLDIDDKEKVMLAQLILKDKNDDVKVSKLDNVKTLTEQGGSAVENLAKYNVAYNDNKTLESFSDKQTESLIKLRDEKGWTEEDLLKAANAVISVGEGKDYGFSGTKNGIARQMLKTVGFTDEQAKEFANAYSSTSGGNTGGTTSGSSNGFTGSAEDKANQKARNDYYRQNNPNYAFSDAQLNAAWKTAGKYSKWQDKMNAVENYFGKNEDGSSVMPASCAAHFVRSRMGNYNKQIARQAELASYG